MTAIEIRPELLNTLSPDEMHKLLKGTLNIDRIKDSNAIQIKGYIYELLNKHENYDIMRGRVILHTIAWLCTIMVIALQVYTYISLNADI